ncbi:MAG: mono/diheme cytochrome c family protein [Candidatus Binatia bacterium]|jgi:mono/diheme cytochrome c family protein
MPACSRAACSIGGFRIDLTRSDRNLRFRYETGNSISFGSAPESGGASRLTQEQKVLAIFQKNCADCHAPGEEEPPSLDKATNLLQLRNNSDYVIAGAPEKSLLFQRLWRGGS